jgi:sulfotransferase family protein
VGLALSQRAREAATRLRSAGPEPLTQLGRRAYARASEATAGLRMEPSFILIGAQRSGTTSLFRALTAHPQLAPPTFRKGVNYFDLNYYRGGQWYRAHFPVAEIARRRAGRQGPPVAFEASGYYLYHPQAMERLGHDMPAVRLIAMLRDPVERAFSAHKHELARGYEREGFERALALEDERLAGEVERIRADPGYESFAHRHHSYRHRGQYAEQLERVYEFFPRAQVHVIDSADYFRQPALEYRRLLAFLGLRPFEPAFAAANARPGPPMPGSCRRMLEEHFQPHDERLAKLLGRQPSWIR